MCQYPFATEILPIKETLHSNWCAYDNMNHVKFKDLHSLLAVSRYVCNMQAIFRGEFVHGNLSKDQCVFSWDNSINSFVVKVSNFTQTYLQECPPLLMNNQPWLTCKMDSDCKMSEFTYALAYGDAQNFSVLKRWFDILCFIDNIRTSSSQDKKCVQFLEHIGSFFADEENRYIKDMFDTEKRITRVSALLTLDLKHFTDNNLQRLASLKPCDFVHFLQTLIVNKQKDTC